MADATSNLFQLQELQANKTQAINELIDALSPASFFGRNANLSGLLQFALYGGKVVSNGSQATVPNTILNMTPNSENYIELDRISNVFTVNQTAFTPGRIPLYRVTTNSASVSSYIDFRSVITNNITVFQSTTNASTTLNAFQVLSDTIVVNTQPAARTLVFPAVNRMHLIHNRSGFTVTISNGTQTVTILNNTTQRVLIEPTSVTII